MGIKTAKNTFSKIDVIDILKQNVVLYKDEPEFVEYIVNLALYLIDQTYLKSGERPSTLESVLKSFEKARADHEARAAADDANEVLDQADSIDEEELDEQLEDEFVEELEERPATNKMRLAALDAVFKSPPAPEFATPAPPEPAKTPTSGSTPIPAAGEKPPSAEEVPEDFDLDLPKTKQLKSVGILTPEPEQERERGPKIQIDQTGRTRVYKVVRSEGQEFDGNCPICGQHIGQVSRCPSCGHIL